MEHPEQLFLNKENTLSVQQHQQVFSLLFEELPTYEQIVYGTPKLSPIFAITKPQQDAEALLVSLGLVYKIRYAFILLGLNVQ